VLGVVGPNGAGKTTLFNALCGVDDFQAGTVSLDGRDLGRRLPAELCGFLPEQSRLFPQLTARQACRFEAAMRRLEMDEDALGEHLIRFGCAGFRDTEVRRLSQGMTRRLGIACAFLGGPRVVVLDEPLNGLDVEGVLLFRRALADYLDGGGIALMSSHILSVLDEVCQRVVLLKTGWWPPPWTCATAAPSVPTWTCLDTEWAPSGQGRELLQGEHRFHGHVEVAGDAQR